MAKAITMKEYWKSALVAVIVIVAQSFLGKIKQRLLEI